MITPPKLPRLMVIGHARSGKDTACEYLADRYGFRHVSSSIFVGKHAVWPFMNPNDPRCGWVPGYPTYSSFEECFEDRANHRSKWFDRIAAYNAMDPARLGVELYREYDIYCGLRSDREFQELRRRKVFDHSIWIDASKRCAPEGADSCTVTPEGGANFILPNNETLEEFYGRLDTLMRILDVPAAHPVTEKAGSDQ